MHCLQECRAHLQQALLTTIKLLSERTCLIARELLDVRSLIYNSPDPNFVFSMGEMPHFIDPKHPIDFELLRSFCAVLMCDSNIACRLALCTHF